MGRFILTGSSSPQLLENISETLAGRIAIIQLGTLKANEYYEQPLSPFYEMFKKPLGKEAVKLMKPPRSLQEMQYFWFKGGYPEILGKSDSFCKEWMIDYESTYLNRDVAKLFPKLDKIAYRRFISMLGKLSSKILNKSEIARSVGVSEPTIRQYLEIVQGTFAWRLLPSFENGITKSVVKMPRGHIRDSGLLHYLLRLYSLETLQEDPIAGFSFEAFIIEEILKGLQDAGIRGVDTYYYRTRGGSEIDLILQGTFGLIPIEIKYGVTVLNRQLKSLNDFVITHQLPFAMVISQHEEMRWINERILHVPAGCL